MANIFGDNHGGLQAGYIKNFHSHDQKPEDPDQACLRSLAYRNMYIKSGDKERVAGSGEWVFEHAYYKQWHKDGGVLWIRGRAGCGKSMLMNRIVEKEQAREVQADGLTVMSFSFQRDGDESQRSAGGLFRSLLHQLLRVDSKLLAGFRAETDFDRHCAQRGHPGTNWDWSESELRVCFNRFIRLASKKGRRVCIYLDALDKCGEETALSLLSCLQKVAAETESHVSTCFSSRPYPFVAIEYDAAINVEEENGDDMEAFLASEFASVSHLRPRTELQTVIEQLISQASGLFQWLAWVSPRTLKLIHRGESVATILKKIGGYPEELGDVYEEVL
ncbi:hypothetical protein LTR36_007433 [Oleoguttula mirabilis]|uniref:Nephrocystin 3-like N-terminal domain-containing protein n=1 Tax=Oleoguttula mirabilis TaxID=1507867 RepID=A0AAV9J9F0_9PEZI|nr:hypothetical protein LTR36_007433 [Oleoguttula mirabilis]